VEEHCKQIHEGIWILTHKHQQQWCEDLITLRPRNTSPHQTQPQHQPPHSWLPNPNPDPRRVPMPHRPPATNHSHQPTSSPPQTRTHHRATYILSVAHSLPATQLTPTPPQPKSCSSSKPTISPTASTCT
jgi:hypothetical protein